MLLLFPKIVATASSMISEAFKHFDTPTSGSLDGSAYYRAPTNRADFRLCTSHSMYPSAAEATRP